MNILNTYKIYIIKNYFFSSPAQSHSTHYKGIVKIEMEVFRNNEVIGYSNYFFELLALLIVLEEEDQGQYFV